MELIFFFLLDSGKKFLNCSRPLFASKAFSLESLLFYWAPWHLLVSLFTKSSNNYREEGAIAFPKVGSFSINFLK